MEDTEKLPGCSHEIEQVQVKIVFVHRVLLFLRSTLHLYHKFQQYQYYPVCVT